VRFFCINGPETLDLLQKSPWGCSATGVKPTSAGGLFFIFHHLNFAIRVKFNLSWFMEMEKFCESRVFALGILLFFRLPKWLDF
jgi:hypothetical protein